MRTPGVARSWTERTQAKSPWMGSPRPTEQSAHTLLALICTQPATRPRLELMTPSEARGTWPSGRAAVRPNKCGR